MPDPEDRKLTIPVLYVDAAQVHVFPYTVQLVLGSTTPDGVAPHIQLALAPAFAIELASTLQRAVQEYVAAQQPDVEPK
jgi:hypothetical protein